MLYVSGTFTPRQPGFLFGSMEIHSIMGLEHVVGDIHLKVDKKQVGQGSGINFKGTHTMINLFHLVLNSDTRLGASNQNRILELGKVTYSNSKVDSCQHPDKYHIQLSEKVTQGCFFSSMIIHLSCANLLIS